MATKRRVSKKKVTLAEFKAWLQGVEELHPDDWTPDAGQWKLIRAKINSIKDEPPQVIQQVVERPTVSASSMPQSALQTAPEPVFVPPAHSEMTPEAKAALSGQLPSEMVPGADGKLKTSNIDTTDGSYQSNFS